MPLEEEFYQFHSYLARIFRSLQAVTIRLLISFVKRGLKVNSTKFTDEFREQKIALIVPGDHFRADRYLRIGSGAESGYLEAVPAAPRPCMSLKPYVGIASNRSSKPVALSHVGCLLI